MISASYLPRQHGFYLVYHINPIALRWSSLSADLLVLTLHSYSYPSSPTLITMLFNFMNNVSAALVIQNLRVTGPGPFTELDLLESHSMSNHLRHPPLSGRLDHQRQRRLKRKAST